MLTCSTHAPSLPCVTLLTSAHLCLAPFLLLPPAAGRPAVWVSYIMQWSASVSTTNLMAANLSTMP